MKINTKIVLKNLEGKSYKTEGKDTTLGAFVASALSKVKSPDPMMSYVLSQDFFGKSEIDITATQIAFVQDRLKEADAFPHVIGQCLMILDGKDTEVVKKK